MCYFHFKTPSMNFKMKIEEITTDLLNNACHEADDLIINCDSLINCFNKSLIKCKVVDINVKKLSESFNHCTFICNNFSIICADVINSLSFNIFNCRKIVINSVPSLTNNIFNIEDKLIINDGTLTNCSVNGKTLEHKSCTSSINYHNNFNLNIMSLNKNVIINDSNITCEKLLMDDIKNNFNNVTGKVNKFYVSNSIIDSFIECRMNINEMIVKKTVTNSFLKCNMNVNKFYIKGDVMFSFQPKDIFMNQNEGTHLNVGELVLLNNVIDSFVACTITANKVHIEKNFTSETYGEFVPETHIIADTVTFGTYNVTFPIKMTVNDVQVNTHETLSRVQLSASLA